MNKFLADAFETAVTEEDDHIVGTEHVEADFEFARQHTISTILKAEDALEKMVELAEASQAPRAFEVVATLVKTLLDGNKDLMELSQRNRTLMTPDRKLQQVPGPGGTTNFFLTTEELQKKLMEAGVDTGLREIKTIEAQPNTKKENDV
jgi:hypothetical protein